MTDLQELLIAVKAGETVFSDTHPEFEQILALVDRADELGLLSNVDKTNSKRRGDRYGACIAVTIKGGLTPAGDRWLEQRSHEA